MKIRWQILVILWMVAGNSSLLWGQAKPATSVEMPISFFVDGDEEDRLFEIRLRAELAKSFDFNYQELTLREVAEDFSKKLKVPVVFEQKDLDEVGVDPDKKQIWLVREKMLARGALKMILADHGLNYFPRDRQLVISNPEHGSSTRIYPVADLLPKRRAPGEERGQRDFDSLIQLITSTIAPNWWSDVGGPSPDIEVVGDAALSIRQFWQVHLEIEQLLTKLRQVQREFKANPLVVTTPVIDVFDRASATRKAMQKIDSLRFDGTLKELTALIESTLGWPVALSEKELDEAGINSDSRVKGSYDKVPIAVGLRSLLRPLGLTFRYDDSAVIITNPDAATKPENQECLMCPVWDLPDPRSLVDAIRGIGPLKLWTELGGPNHIALYLDPQVFVVKCDSELAEKVAPLFANLRKIEAWRKQLPDEETQPKFIKRIFSLCRHTREQVPVPDKPLQKEYVTKETPLTATETKEVIAFIKRNVSTQTWEGKDIRLDFWENELLLQHSPAVVREVQELLRQLGLIPNDPFR